MILLKRVMPFVAPLVTMAIFLGLYLAPQQWTLWLCLLISSIILSCIALSSPESSPYMLLRALPLLVFVGGATGILFFVTALWQQIVVALVIATVIGLYLEDVFFYTYQPQQYRRLSLSDFSLLLFSGGIASGAAALFGTLLIGQVSVVAILIGIFVGMLVGTIQLLWAYNVLTRDYVLQSVPIFLVFAELIWVIHYFPTSFYVNGTLLGAVFYGTVGLFVLHARDILTRSLIIQYVSVTAAVIAAILLTAQWT